MAATDTLGELEELVLLAVLRLGEDAYGAEIRRELEARAGRRVALGTAYVTLTRLVEKGLATSAMGEPEPVPGGKARRIFAATEAGREALRQTYRARSGMWEGLHAAVGIDGPEPGA